MTKSILFAYDFDYNGFGAPLEGSAVAHTIKDDQLAWVHFDGNHPETSEWLEEELSYLDPFIVKALLAEETRPRMTAIKDGVLLILRGVNLNENGIIVTLWPK